MKLLFTDRKLQTGFDW